jgi:hypothetical protein
MPPFIKELFNEVKMEMLKIALINSFLDSIMVFFVIYFIVSFFKNIAFLYVVLIPGVITIIYFFTSLVISINKLRLKTMEDANPQVKEMLRTAHDNMNSESIMSMALFAELKGKMKTVSSGNLLESKKIIIRIVSAVVIVFLIIFVSSFKLPKINLPFEIPRFMGQNNNRYAQTEGNLTELDFNETEVMYGDPSIAKLGNDQINLNVNPTLSDIDFNNVGEAENDELATGSMPQEIGVNADAFNNQQQLEEAEQAANYSQRIKDI